MLNWTGKTAVVLASGPSLTREQCLLAEGSGFPTIVTNATFRLVDNPTVVYMGDMMAVKQYAAEVRATRPNAQFWTQDANAAARWGLQFIRGINKEGLSVKPDRIHLNGNSGSQAINLAYVFGARRILLAGFDMGLGPNGEKHWHPDHPRPLVQGQCFEDWTRKAARLAHDLREVGCQVVNCSIQSALHCWPRGDLQEELAK